MRSRRLGALPRSSTQGRFATVVTSGLGLGVLLGALGGCVKPLFPEDTPRTQFETYDRMRARFVPLVEPDVFGTPRPALRARLGQ